MTASLITVPAIGSAHDGVRHFFGTRHPATAYETSVPVPSSDRRDYAWALSGKQVHGADALFVGRARCKTQRFQV